MYSHSYDYLKFWILPLIWMYVSTEKPPNVKLKIDEESPIHTTLGNISNFLFPQSKITTDTPFFTVTSNGLVQLVRRLDLEALCPEQALCCEREKMCELKSTIVIEGRNSMELQLVELFVLVMDVNDHPPKFASSTQSLKISELTEPGSLFPLQFATDADLSSENQVLRYTIHGLEIQQNFELDTTDLPNVNIRLTRALDYEMVTSYTGRLEACDRQQCVQQNLTIFIIDANDNKPKFRKHSYEITIPENFTVGQTVLTLDAEDRDSEPNARPDFQIQADADVNLRRTFRLESNTGRLILHSRLAAHQRREYRFTVTVGEQLNNQMESTNDNIAQQTRLPTSPTDSASVLINVQDLNDFSPAIKMISPLEGQPLILPENSPNLRVCVLQVTDNDLDNNGRVKCSLLPTMVDMTSNMEAFRLTQTENLYTLLTTRQFDAEHEPQLTVTIACSDFGTPPRSSSRDLIIQIGDLNEYQPELERINYYASIKENAKTGIEVLQVIASDQDQTAKLYYELGSEGKQYFAIDSSTGVITTLGDQHLLSQNLPQSSLLDREKTEKVTFPVCVTDGTPTTACGVTYSIEEQHKSKPQSSDTKQIIHTVTATVVITILDENDNRPTFISKGPFSIAENQPRFTQVTGRLSALDPDEDGNGHVRYNLQRTWVSATGVPTPDVFQVDSEGQIRSLEVLDREMTNAYTLEIMACDSAPLNPLCTNLNITITISDENDNKPEWHYPHARDKEVNITTDLPPGRIVARVLAMDSDANENGRVVYSLIDPHRRTVFQIDNTTGEISVINNQLNELIRSQDSGYLIDDPNRITPLHPGVYRLRLRASDLGHPEQASETWLQINVSGSEVVTNAGLNFMIIVIMIAITGVISICLVVAIICVRRRSSPHWGRNSQPRQHMNGVRRGPILANGTASSMFQLKGDYGRQLESTGYLMGVSPTPSDLDAFKLAYQTNLNPYLDNGNLGSDAHLYSWSAVANSYPAIYYQPQCGNLLNHSSICGASSIDANETNLDGSLSQFGSANLNRKTCTLTPDQSNNNISINNNNNGNNDNNNKGFVRFPSLHSYPNQMGASTSNLSFTTRGATVEQVGLLPTFNEINSQLNENSVNEMRDSDTEKFDSKQIDECVLNSMPVSKQSYAPLMIGTNTGVGCCVAPTRRPAQNGTLHCELDVESADSGRGASEDDPSQMGGQLLHFYPSCHLTNNQQNSLHSLNESMRSGTIQNLKSHSGTDGNDRPEPIWNPVSTVNRRFKL